ncbi:MAG: urease accessory protein UreD [Pseudomonadota bacterium]
MTFDAAFPSDPGETAALQPRARGHIALGVKAADGRTRLARLRHQGSAKCLLPRLPDNADGRIEGVVVNTAGGITGGDRFLWEAETGPGTRLSLTTQAAERAYRAHPGEIGRLETRLTLGPDSTLAWLPQETILYDRGALERRLSVDMDPSATLLALEPLVLGRAAMGETVENARLIDRWQIRRDGRLVFADTLRLDGPVAEIAARPACFGPNRAGASLVLVAPFAADRLAAARAAIDTSDMEGGASGWDDLLAIRLLALDALRLRRALADLLIALAIVPLPSVWKL